MESKNITLRVNSELYDKYREFCKKKGLLISRQVEIMMEEQLKEGARKWTKRITTLFFKEIFKEE